MPGLAYELSCGPNLISGLDSVVFGPTTAAVGQAEMSYTAPTAGGSPNRFYRIGVRRP